MFTLCSTGGSMPERNEEWPWRGKWGARVAHLRPNTMIGVACSCGHQTEIRSAVVRFKFPPAILIRDLPIRFRCRQCGRRGGVTLYVGASIGRGLSPDSSVP
jgi:hypothetical protein